MAKTINAIDQYVGNRVRLRRRTLGFTQRQLAKAVGVSFQQIGPYENGIYRITAGRLEQIAKALSVTPSFFFEQDVSGHQVPSEEIAATLRATAEGVELIKAFSRIRCPRMRRTVIGIIGQLAEEAVGGPVSEQLSQAE
ncbi:MULTISPECIES: helix-turn-helix transcriptional regulator [unclassified Bosea (in: a-proteobacteria)]|uniref:helix-turn-helix domain-containing protein n=1 Tax=unclassified Bosea (in: a-proteobacteria) TaxID=2653178 RepID=UPI000F754B30|nr:MULTISPECIES: helix-turn-helix transcriptional regulator [unclassified Bosea (in: a-proteobacteria)]AZO81866.1 hypothetical protein BLM15_29045 [Bosea sp. Tri-49]